MPLKASGNLRSQAQSTVDYFYRVAREHPDGERPENPISPETTYDTQSPPPDDLSRHDADLREKEHARNVAEFRDLRPSKNPDSEKSPIAAKLAELSSISAEEDDDEAPSPPRTTQHPPELIEYDRQVPLIAEPGVDRRRARPEWRFRDRSGSGTGQKAVSDASASEPVTPNVVAFTPASENAHSLRNDVQTSPLDSSADSSAARDRLRSATQVETVPPEPAYTNPFFDVSENRRNNISSLHGPSFLGLDSDSDVEYLDDDEAASHVRRNIALLVLLIVAVLAAVQWRSIRDFSLRYAGTMHLPGRKIAAASPADSPAANSNTASPAATTTPQANGQPEIVTEPVRNPNAAQNSNSTQNSGATGANSDSASPAPSSASGTSASTSPASSSDRSGDNAIASNTDNSRLPQGEPADDAGDNSASNRADEENSSAARTPARKPVETSRPDPGQAELAQASAALDPASQVSLLWKAVGKGSAEAQLRLADLYLEGRGVPQNCEQALVLLKSASNKNYSRARIRLGSLYATGKCVPQDRVVAYHWMSLALDSSPGSQWVEENRQMLWSQMSEEERRRAGGKM